jgi:hypothetical protein
VLDGFVSPQAARDLYGVVLDDDGTFDAIATGKLRAQRREEMLAPALASGNEQLR